MPRLFRLLVLAMILSQTAGLLHAQGQTEAAQEEPVGMYITEYRIQGSKHLDRRVVEKAVYPFLGPERKPADVDQARAALEKAYRDAGYQTVTVLIPEQSVKKGVVILEVVETPVGRLRVRGSRYQDLDRLKKSLPSLAEGNVPNINDFQRELAALNRRSGVVVTPSFPTPSRPGVVDIDLNVKEESPLHGSIELHNRHTRDTTPWRIDAGLSYANLWQLRHTLGLSLQAAPERTDDALTFSGFYMMPVPGHDRWTLTLDAMKQDSDISTLGGAAVVGRGHSIGLSAGVSLPEKSGFFHSLTLGVDYKSFEEDLVIGGVVLASPVTYYPISLNYSANWIGQKSSTALNAGVTFSVRGQGTKSEEFLVKRYNADDGFFYFRGDLSHTHELPGKLEIYGKVQGQASSGPLINNEQISGGGVSNVRGYYEATSLGDNGVFGSVELRSPSLLKIREDGNNEWRFYIFADGGVLTLNDPLPEQDSQMEFASIGIGSRFRILNHLSGSLDAGFPLIRYGETDIGEMLLTVRFSADF